MTQDLIVPFQQGVPSAFDQVFNLYWSGLVLFAERITQDKEESEDIVIRIFHTLWEKRSNFESITNIKAFLYISTRNACFNFLKYRGRQQQQSKEMFDHLEQSDELEFELVKDAEIYALLYEQIENLRGNIKRVMQMIFYEGIKKNHEIANRLGISVKTVEKTKDRGIKQLLSRIQARKSRLGFNTWFLFLILYFMLVYLCKWYFGKM